jgi:alkane 1-monooxygenase
MTKNSFNYNIYFYLLGFIPFILTIVGNVLGGYWIAANLILILILIPLDSAWKVNKVAHKSSHYTYGILVGVVTLQAISLVTFLLGFKFGNIDNSNLVLAILSNGLMLGMGVTIAGHELIHSKPKWAKNLGILSLFLSLYTFHFVEHIQGHHRHVSQEKDPTSAKLNQSFYNYLFIGFWVEMWHGFQIEAKRLVGKNKLSWGINNFVVRWTLLEMIFLISIGYFFGVLTLISYLAISFISIAFHYIVMYSQHYGLSRDEDEKTLAEHSWQNNSWISEYFFLGFINHSEHHTKVTKGYSEIVILDNAPDIRTGYFGIIPLVLIPSIWKNKANKIIKNM